MESETIDLTDPLEEILKNTSCTPESLNERLSSFYDAQSNTQNNTPDSITLSDLLKSHKYSSETPALEPEVIQLSDDEVYEVGVSEERNVCESDANCTEVQVIELNDVSDQESCNSDQYYDDDDMFEESFTNNKSLLIDETISSDKEVSLDSAPPSESIKGFEEENPSEASQEASTDHLPNRSASETNDDSDKEEIFDNSSQERRDKTCLWGDENDSQEDGCSFEPSEPSAALLADSSLESVCQSESQQTTWNFPTQSRSEVESKLADNLIIENQNVCSSGNLAILEPTCLSESQQSTLNSSTLSLSEVASALDDNPNSAIENQVEDSSSQSQQSTANSQSESSSQEGLTFDDNLNSVRENQDVCSSESIAACLLESKPSTLNSPTQLQSEVESTLEDTHTIGDPDGCGSSNMDDAPAETPCQSESRINSPSQHASGVESTLDEILNSTVENQDESEGSTSNSPTKSPSEVESRLDNIIDSTIETQNDCSSGKIAHQESNDKLNTPVTDESIQSSANTDAMDESCHKDIDALVGRIISDESINSIEIANDDSEDISSESKSEDTSSQNSDPAVNMTSIASSEREVDLKYRNNDDCDIVSQKVPDPCQIDSAATIFSKASCSKTVENPQVEEDAPDVNLDDIRKKLLMQLTSLRTRKKNDILQNVKQTDTNHIFLKPRPFGELCSKKSSKSLSPPTKTDNVDRPTPNASSSSDSVSEEPKTDPLKAQPEVTEAQSKESHEFQEDEDVSNVFKKLREIIRKPKSLSSSYLKSTALTAASDTNHTSKEQLSKENINPPKSSGITSSEPSKDTIGSPFVSNTLDEFLSDAKLNVSYSIPKCDAEEGLHKDYTAVDPVIAVEASVKDEERGKSKKGGKYKPKTLAEKRRILEKNNAREQRRLEKLKLQEQLQKRSYVYFKNKKVYLKSKWPSKCIASIQSDIKNLDSETMNLPKTPTKPSLLTDYYRKASSPVKYRPGPLSKKPMLQSDYSRWRTELKTLPKVMLNVMPQLGKPVHPNLLPVILCNWTGEVSEDQVDFALSALINSAKEEPRIFTFHVPYAKHQKQLIVRRENVNNSPVKIECKTTRSSSIEEEVAKVIDDLIKYVEIKELAPSLTKVDGDSSPAIEILDKAPVKAKDLDLTKKKQSRTFSRTSKELLRLNCRVVSMEVKENEPETKCVKPHCKLGCLCKSLRCDTIIGLHCRKSKCIFGCSCPKEKNKIINISDPFLSANIGADFLSTDTVTRIEDEAKKNLAKVEKEFTQTIIYANNKTIVVGATGNKPRRAAKTPKKYTDFFDEDIFKETVKEVKKESKPLVKPCTVDVENWDFSDLTPYCLVHNLHNCYCEGHSTFPSTLKPKAELKPDVSREVKKIHGKRKSDNLDLEWTSSKVEESTEELYSVTGRPLRIKKSVHRPDFVRDPFLPPSNKRRSLDLSSSADAILPSCSRTVEVPFYHRKSKPRSESATIRDFENNITEADLLKEKLKVSEEEILESELFKWNIIDQKRTMFLAEQNWKKQVSGQKRTLSNSERSRDKHHRKQLIEVRQDFDLNVSVSRPVPANITPPKKKIKPIFNGEIIVSDSAMLKKLYNTDNNTKPPMDSYARILPWNALLKGFLNRSIHVYCICDMPLRLLLNTGPKIIRDKVLDVEYHGSKIMEAPLKGKAPWLVSQSESVRNIIKWLLSGCLSSRYKNSSLSFLLVETLPGQFEVRGLCTQNDVSQQKQITCDSNSKAETVHIVSDDITEIKHKNMMNQIESLFITKANFKLRELVEAGSDDDHVDGLYMWVGLPEVFKVAKWKVVFLKNDFVYLYFINIKYSIKYSDLSKLTDIAKEEKQTLLIRNLQIRRSYPHSLYGLYVSPKYSDRIFIGPYFAKHTKEDIDTLKYMNNSLISSSHLSKMKGNENFKCGSWLYERAYYRPPRKFVQETVDLTNDEPPAVITPCEITSDENKMIEFKNITQVRLSPTDEQTITHNGLPVHIRNSKPRAPSEFNRFIITNIPHFGYLGAYQSEHSTKLEVSWPFEKKVLVFQTADHARDFLQERFNQLLQPVPETFKIQVIVLLNLDLNEHQPINSDFLSGHCICGYFGTYNFKEISEEFCERELKVTKEEITKLFAKRAHEYIRVKMLELAQIVDVDANDKDNFNVSNILNKAKNEIKLQEHQRVLQVAEIYSLENAVVANMKKVFEMVKNLPAKERNIESKILNDILQIRPRRSGVKSASEVIEINDDDAVKDDADSSWNNGSNSGLRDSDEGMEAEMTISRVATQ